MGLLRSAPVRMPPGEDKGDSGAEYTGLVDFDAYRREQAQWLRQEIGTQAFRKARFRVALAHMPFPWKAGTTIPPFGAAAQPHRAAR